MRRNTYTGPVNKILGAKANVYSLGRGTKLCRNLLRTAQTLATQEGAGFPDTSVDLFVGFAAWWRQQAETPLHLAE